MDSPCGFRGCVALPPSNYIFCSHKHVLKRFNRFKNACESKNLRSSFIKKEVPFLWKMIGGFVNFVFSKGLLCIRHHCSINICFKFLTAGWYVVTKGNKRSWPFGFCVCLRVDFQEAKLTPDRHLSMMFFGYPLALRRCLNFKPPSSNVFFEELVLGNFIGCL